MCSLCWMECGIVDLGWLRAIRPQWYQCCNLTIHRMFIKPWVPLIYSILPIQQSNYDTNIGRYSFRGLLMHVKQSVNYFSNWFRLTRFLWVKKSSKKYVFFQWLCKTNRSTNNMSIWFYFLKDTFLLINMWLDRGNNIHCT